MYGKSFFFFCFFFSLIRDKTLNEVLDKRGPDED